MALIIFPAAYYTSEGSSQAFPNSATLLKLNTDSNGNLTFNGDALLANPLEVAYSVSLSWEMLLSKSIPLPHDCDNSRIITLSVNGVAFSRGDFWEVSELNFPLPDSIVWQGLGLDGFLQVGDNILISYYKKS